MKQTPIIHVDSIKSQKYLGVVEIDEGETHLVQLETASGSYLVAGGACNAGLIPDYARELDLDFESLDEALQEFLADLEDTDYPSGELLAWHGSLVI